LISENYVITALSPRTPADGALLVRVTARAGPVYYAKWRDSTRTQQMRRIGPAWVELRDGSWQKRRGACPEHYLGSHAAAARMRALVAAHEAELVELAADRASGRFDRRNATFAEVAAAWREHGRTVAGWKPATLADRESMVRAHLLPAFGRRALREITRDHVRAWWRDLHSPDYKGGGRSRPGKLSDRNANKALTDLRAIFNWALEEYGLPANPAAGIRKHREYSAEKPDFYSVQEVLALIAAAASEQDALMFRVAAFVGLRRGEVVALRWRNVDLDRSLVYVVDNVSGGEDVRVKDGEGRTVPLAPQVLDALKTWRTADAQGDDRVFPGQLHGRIDPQGLSLRFKAARNAAGLRPLRFHDLRHTFGSLAVDGGASIIQVQSWLGHADVSTTMRYLHSKSRAQDAALLGAAFAS
jgi:integrase